jgi:hypothetical protein
MYLSSFRGKEIININITTTPNYNKNRDQPENGTLCALDME